MYHQINLLLFIAIEHVHVYQQNPFWMAKHDHFPVEPLEIRADSSDAIFTQRVIPYFLLGDVSAFVALS